MIVVVDASVAVKWLLPEPLSEPALALLGSSHDLIAPDLITLEVGSALLRAKQQRRIDEHALQDGFARMLSLLAFRVPLSKYEAAAFEIALRYGSTIQDACYLAVAQSTSARLATADRQQAATSRAMRLAASSIEDGFADLLPG